MSTAKQQKKYYELNPEKFKAKAKKFRKDNPESARKSVQKWAKKHPGNARNRSRKFYHKLRKENPEESRRRARANKLKYKYGITLEQEQQMLIEQKYCCKTCGKHESIVGKLVPDHNHQTKRVRGMLCNGCNRALGQVEENIIVLKNLISYLEEDLECQKEVCAPILSLGIPV
jgi:hypothetical protein